MKKRITIIAAATFFLAFVFTANLMADDGEPNIPISAHQAFDAVVKQVDPDSGESTRVALVDVRTAAEFWWIGACGKVESLSTERKEYFPIDGKVTVKWGNYLSFKVKRGHRARRVVLPIHRVTDIETVDISLHIPFKTWNDAEVGMEMNLDFNAQIESLAADYDVVILMCRSGKRSDYTGFNRDLFDAVYEIDQPSGSTGKGGFQGTSYGNTYNGYRGYPGRSTRRQDQPSASWSDAGLPVHIGTTPFTITTPTYSDPEPQ